MCMYIRGRQTSQFSLQFPPPKNCPLDAKLKNETRFLKKKILQM